MTSVMSHSDRALRACCLWVHLRELRWGRIQDWVLRLPDADAHGDAGPYDRWWSSPCASASTSDGHKFCSISSSTCVRLCMPIPSFFLFVVMKNIDICKSNEILIEYVSNQNSPNPNLYSNINPNVVFVLFTTFISNLICWNLNPYPIRTKKIYK